MNRPDIEVAEPAILIRIRRLFDPHMSSQALYEATRGVWKVGERREGAQFALAVADGVVREVYTIHTWHPAGSTPYETRPRKSVEIEDRWEFTGAVAPEKIREKHIDRSVAHYFAKGAANPIQYVNC